MIPIYVPEDDGCEFSRSCLTCPLPMCAHDFPGGPLAWKKGIYDRNIVDVVRREGLTAEAAADRFGIGVRTIFRIQQRVRKAGTVEGP